VNVVLPDGRRCSTPSPSSTVIPWREEIVSFFFPVREQDADRRRARLAGGRTGVVGGEDLVGRVALQGVTLRAPLPHAHAVPVPVAADEEERARAGRRDVLVDTVRPRRVRHRDERDGDDEGEKGGEGPGHAETLLEGSVRSVRTTSILRATFARRRSLGLHTRWRPGLFAFQEGE
jgi:hypothetical protein